MGKVNTEPANGSDSSSGDPETPALPPSASENDVDVEAAGRPSDQLHLLDDEPPPTPNGDDRQTRRSSPDCGEKTARPSLGGDVHFDDAPVPTIPGYADMEEGEDSETRAAAAAPPAEKKPSRSVRPSLADDYSDAPPSFAEEYIGAIYEDEDPREKTAAKSPANAENRGDDAEVRLETESLTEAPVPLHYYAEMRSLATDPIGEKPTSTEAGGAGPRSVSLSEAEGTAGDAVVADRPASISRGRPVPPAVDPRDAASIPERTGVPPPSTDESVQFYHVEARVVRDSEAGSEGEDDDRRRRRLGRTSETVYDATPLDLTTSWWQKHQRAVLLSIGIAILSIAGAVAAIGVRVIRSGTSSQADDDPSVSIPLESAAGPTAVPTALRPILTKIPSTNSPTPAPVPTAPTSLPTQSLVPTSPPTPAPLPPVNGLSRIALLRNFSEAGCQHDCLPYVVLDGTTAFVSPLGIKPFDGEPAEGLPPDWESRIHVWNRTADDAWEEVQRIDAGFQPGTMAVVGDAMAVGSPWEMQETGAVYVYGRNRTGLWNERQRIVPEDRRIDAGFGYHVVMDENIMVVGAFNDRDRKIGSVYVYRLQDAAGWVLEQKIAPPDDGKTLNFGLVVAIRGNRIAVGDRAYGTNKTAVVKRPKGAVWVYEYDSASKNWTAPNDVVTNHECDNWFGASLVFTQDSGLLVGCPKEGGKVGAVYYYVPSEAGYTFRQKVVASDGGHLIGDANQISVDGNVMMVGSPKSRGAAVYAFLRINDVWVESQQKIVSPEDKNKFGDKVSLSGNQILVSSKKNAYFYEFVEGPSAIICLSHASDGVILEGGCTQCDRLVDLDGDTALISTKKESLRFVYGADGSFDKTYFYGIDHVVFGGITISDGVTVYGAPRSNEKIGSVSVLQVSEDGVWWETARLSPDVARPLEHFGTAVDVHGDAIVVGAYFYNRLPARARGSAYVFRRDGTGPGWVQEAKLLPDDPNLTSFGSDRALAIVNDIIAIGDNMYMGSRGAVFVYEYEPSSQSWNQLDETITNDDCDGNFGASLALTRGDGLLIGCPGEQYAMGAIYYYTRVAPGSGYILQQKIQSLDGMSSDRFGDSDQIAVDGDIMVVGTSKVVNGTVHIFAKENNAWVEVNSIKAPPESARFGYRVAVSGMKVLVASMYNVYSYTLEQC